MDNSEQNAQKLVNDFLNSFASDERARTAKLISDIKEIQCAQYAWIHTKTKEPMTIGEIVQRAIADYELSSKGTPK